MVYALSVVAASIYAAYLDVRTTEVPDWVSGVIAGLGVIFYTYLSLNASAASPLLASLSTGSAFFLMGWGMYLAGMWGGADAFLLGAVGFAFPFLPPGIEPFYTAPWPFALSLLMTVFLLGSIYSVSYALYTALTSEGFAGDLVSNLRNRSTYTPLMPIYGFLAFFTMVLPLVFPVPPGRVYFNLAALSASLPVVAVLWALLKTVESEYMEIEIPAGEVEEGDVLAEDLGIDPGEDDPVENVSGRIGDFMSGLPLPIPRVRDRYHTRVVGLTAEQAEKVREKEGDVKIKTGVRFIPAFPAALIFLLTIGDPFYLLLHLTL